MTGVDRASPWMTVPEVCEYGRTNRSAVYRALQVGELRGHQHVAPRGTWRVHRDDVDLWLRGEIAGAPVSSIRPHGRK
ncbi:helix-turn-helix domain-containing protein [Rhodococcus sp. BP-241]|nr:helix-turn-helix domain-containing protein [Rhodococcus sp. BP-241]